MTNNKKIVLASIAVIVAAGLLVLNPSIIGDAQEHKRTTANMNTTIIIHKKRVSIQISRK